MCSGQKRALTGNPGGGTWSIVSGPGTINNDTVTAIGPGTMIINYNVNGCSTNQAIIVNASQATASSVNICSGQSIMIHGVSRSTPGIYTQTLLAVNGCDSISAVQLSVVPAVQSNMFLNICDGDSIFAGGAWQKLAGSFSDTIVGGALGGCDSIINTNLVVLSSPVTSSTVSICSGQSANIHGISQSTSGLYSQTFTAANGCDSISDVTLDVGIVGTSTLSASICAGDSLLIGTSWIKQAGVYNDTLTGASQSGCDSIITTSITVNPSPINSSTVTICQDDSLDVHGTFQNTSGVYTQTFSTSFGCDSISTISLNVIASVSSTDTLTICDGDSILIASAYRNTGGTYPDTLFGGSSLGCDSIIYTHLIIENYPSVTLNTYEGTILLGDEIYLTAFGATSYLWDNGETGSSIVSLPVATQTICVYGSSNNGCLDTACYAVKVIDPNCEANDLFIPNAFSPNGDGVNDQLCVLGTDCFKSFTVKIYDRWGNLIYTMNGKDDCWDGYYKGKLMNTDVFIYELSGLLHSRNTKRVNGNISLLR